jgi:hypothetical protein
VPHHRFIVRYDVILAEPNNSDNSQPDPAPDDLAADLRNHIKSGNPKHNGKPYDVKEVKRVKITDSG